MSAHLAIRQVVSDPKKMGWDNANLSQDFEPKCRRFAKFKKHGESFEAGNMMVKLQEVDGEAPYYNCPYCRNELTVLGGKGGIVAVCENESRCNGLEIPRQYLDDYEKYHWYVNERSSAENFSAEGDMKTCGNCGGESDADNFNECVYCSKHDGVTNVVTCPTEIAQTVVWLIVMMIAVAVIVAKFE